MTCCCDPRCYIMLLPITPQGIFLGNFSYGNFVVKHWAFRPTTKSLSKSLEKRRKKGGKKYSLHYFGMRWPNLRKFLSLAQISKKRCQITNMSTIHLKKIFFLAQDSDLAQFFRDLSQSENISGIKPPLKCGWF